MELWFPYVPITMPSTLCVSLCALPLSPFAALNDALRRFMTLANNLPVTDRVFARGGERPLIDATTIPSNASIRAAVYGPFCHPIALNPINFCECVRWAWYDYFNCELRTRSLASQCLDIELIKLWQWPTISLPLTYKPFNLLTFVNL